MTRLLLISLMFASVSAFGFGSPKIRIASGSMTGVYFPIASALSKMITRHRGYETTVLQTAGSVDNVGRLMRGDVELAIAAADTLYTAYQKLPPYENMSEANTLRVIASIYPELLHVVAHKKCIRSRSTELTSAVLKRCHFNLGPPKSGTLDHADLILEQMNFSPPSAYTKLDFVTATEQIMGGEIDGGFFTVGINSLTLTMLMNSGDYVLLSISPEIAKNIRVKHPFLTTTTLKANTYTHQKNTVETLAVYAQLVTTDRLSFSLARQLMETLMAEIHELRAAHVCGRDFSLQTALVGITIPVHDGAKEFYITQGVISPILNQH